jgi:hypothetical protein
MGSDGPDGKGSAALRRNLRELARPTAFVLWNFGGIVKLSPQP